MDESEKMTETPCVVNNTVYYRNTEGKIVRFELLPPLPEVSRKKWWQFWRKCT